MNSEQSHSQTSLHEAAISRLSLSGRAQSAPILIAAGGTGGHVIPAQAVGQALRRLCPEIPVEFVCGMRPVELRTYWNAGEQPHLLRCGKAPGSGLSGLRRWIQLARAIPHARRLVRRLQPRVVLGMGGYIVAPILLAARRMRIPIVLHESNAVAGRTTRLFSRWAREVLLAYPSARNLLPSGTICRVVGTPVRSTLFGIDRSQAAEVFDLDASMKTLLLIGGSQGARAVNTILLESLPMLETMAQHLGGLQLLWSAGANNHSDISAALEKHTHSFLRIREYPSIQRMDAAYAMADLVMSRAGAGTIAEIMALGLPSVLIPLPGAKDNHQRLNAQALAENGGARIVEESTLTPPSLAKLLGSFFEHPEMLRSMGDAARRQAAPDAAELVAQALLQTDRDSNNAPSLAACKTSIHAN